MSLVKRKCTYFNCDEIKDVHLHPIIDDMYFYLCIGHGQMLKNARRSKITLIEFLIDALGGKEPEYRAKMRMFILEEVERMLDE